MADYLPASTGPDTKTTVDYPITRLSRYNFPETNRIGRYESLRDFCGTLLKFVVCCCNPFAVGCDASN